MQIRSFGGYRPTTTSADDSKELRKSDHVSDIFNHRPKEESDRRGAHVHLSRASRALNDQLGKKLQQLIKQHPNVGKALQHVPIPGEEELSPATNLIRKARAYMQWQQLENTGNEGDAPYLAVQKEDSEGKLSSLFDEIEEKRASLSKERQQALPNYYYMVYPETYSFN